MKHVSLPACSLAAAVLFAAPHLAAQSVPGSRPSIGAHASVYAAEGLRDGWILGVQGSMPLVLGLDFAATYSAWALNPRDFATATFALRSIVHRSASGGPLLYAGAGAIYDRTTPGRVRGIFDTAVLGGELPGRALRPFVEARVSRLIWGGAATVHVAAGASIGPR